MMNRKWIKHIAVTVLVAFMVTFGLPVQQMANAKNMEKSQQNKSINTEGINNIGNNQGKYNIKYETPASTTTLGSFVDTLMVNVDAMRQSLNQGDLKTFKSQVKDTQKKIKDIRKSIQNELKENEKTLNKLKASNAKKKHNQVKTELEGKLNNFEALFAQLDQLAVLAKELKGKDSETIKNKLSEIEKILKPEQPEQALGSLPHNNASMTPPEPAVGGGTTPAYIGGGQTLTSEQVLTKTPVEADLAETSETGLTQDIKDLADSLQTPIKIYEYVRNNIDFEPYYGSRKGTSGTLGQLAGNDYDQASLLIAMLRYKGYPSRYVKGTVEIPIEKVKGWTGAQNPEAAVKVLGSLGIPTVSVVSGGTIVAARIEHIWAEAYVPYGNYRGAGKIQGEKIWVPLDPCFKQYSIEKGLDIKAITGLTDQQILDAFKINADESSDGDAITNVNTDKMNSLLNGAQEKLQNYLKENNLENADAKQLIGGKKIIPQN